MRHYDERQRKELPVIADRRQRDAQTCEVEQDGAAGQEVGAPAEIVGLFAGGGYGQQLVGRDGRADTHLDLAAALIQQLAAEQGRAKAGVRDAGHHGEQWQWACAR